MLRLNILTKEKKAQHGDVKPEGEWEIDSIWIWGFSEPFWIPLNH